MFNQTQRAFRLSMTQSDILEAGRAVTEMIPRELEQIAPSYRNAVNFSAVMIPNSTPLTQSLPGTTLMRTNLLQDCFFLLRQNQTWIGIGYCVRTNDATGRLWLPEVAAGKLGAGTLYRFAATLPVISYGNPGDPNNGLPQDPEPALSSTSAMPASPGSLRDLQPNLRWRGPFPPARLCHQWLPAVQRRHSTPTRVSAPILSPWATAWSARPWRCRTSLTRTIGPASTSASNAVPAAVEMELGLLEQSAWERYNSIGNAAARLAYLQREDISSRVHLFRQRIPIRNVDPLPYQ